MKKILSALIVVCMMTTAGIGLWAQTADSTDVNAGATVTAENHGAEKPGDKPLGAPPDGMKAPNGAGGPGGPGGKPPAGKPGDGAGQGGFGTIADADEPELTAAAVYDGETATVKNVQFEADSADVSVLLAENGASVTVNGGTLSKTAGDTSSEDQSNFHGLNAAVVATSGSTITLNKVTITTDADGSNAVFATGDNSVIYINNSTISTTENSSRGLDATYNGTVIAKNINITTQGDHCAAFATDRGEGTITVTKGTAETHGDGSPVIYSTGNISVTNLTGTAWGSEIAVIEGKNSITLDNVNLTGYAKKGIMLYQSMSGDASIGTSVLTCTGSTLTNAGSGPFFYITNTQSEIYLTNTSLNGVGEVLLQCSGNNSERGWGKVGANGGTVALTASKQKLSGNIICDGISSVTVSLTEKSSWSGAADSENTGDVSISLDKKSTWNVTANSYVSVLEDADTSCKNIVLNGFTVYYDAENEANAWLQGATITSKDGGRITPSM